MDCLIYRPSIRSYDIDINGHVSNLVYLRWMEDARNLMLEAVGLPLGSIKHLPFTPVLAETEIKYIKPLAIGDCIRLELWLSKLSRVAATMEFNFIRGESERVARATQRGLFLDLSTERPYRLLPDEQAHFHRYLSPAPRVQ